MHICVSVLFGCYSLAAVPLQQLLMVRRRSRSVMIFFGNRAEKWQPELTLMNDELRTEAREHVKGLKAPGATAIYDGLVAAFEDPRVDTIYLLTDGGPSGGTIDDIDEIIAEVRRWNSVRQVVIHSVAVGRDSRLLRTLAEECHGGYVRVD